jgi:Trp operon repressor
VIARIDGLRPSTNQYTKKQATPNGATSKPDLAKKLGVGTSTVDRARARAKKLEKARPDLHAKVKSGEMSLKDAEAEAAKTRILGEKELSEQEKQQRKLKSMLDGAIKKVAGLIIAAAASLSISQDDLINRVDIAGKCWQNRGSPLKNKALWRRYSWFESMRGSHST